MKFRHYRYQHFFLFQISIEALTFVISLNLCIQKNGWGKASFFWLHKCKKIIKIYASIEIWNGKKWIINKKSRRKNLKKNVPNFKTVLLNIQFLGIRTFPPWATTPGKFSPRNFLSGQLFFGLLPSRELPLINSPLDNWPPRTIAFYEIPPGQLPLNSFPQGNCPSDNYPLWNSPKAITPWTAFPE